MLANQLVVTMEWMVKPRNIDRKMLIPNTTQVPNVVLDWMMAEMKGPEFKVLMFFIRQTYGFQNPYSKFSYSISEICDGIQAATTNENGERVFVKVCDGTGLTRESAVEAIRKLENYNAVAVHSRGNRKKVNVYELMDFSQFLKSEFRPDLVGNPTNSSRKSDQEKSEFRPDLVGNTDALRNQEETNGNQDKEPKTPTAPPEGGQVVKKREAAEYIKTYQYAFNQAHGMDPRINFGQLGMAFKEVGTQEDWEQYISWYFNQPYWAKIKHPISGLYKTDTINQWRASQENFQDSEQRRLENFFKKYGSKVKDGQ